jgi:hypothetical protein
MNTRILAKRMQLDLQKLFAFILASIFRGEQNNSVPHVCRQGSTQRGHVEVSHKATVATVATIVAVTGENPVTTLPHLRPD